MVYSKIHHDYSKYDEVSGRILCHLCPSKKYYNSSHAICQIDDKRANDPSPCRFGYNAFTIENLYDDLYEAKKRKKEENYM